MSLQIVYFIINIIHLKLLLQLYKKHETKKKHFRYREYKGKQSMKELRLHRWRLQGGHLEQILSLRSLKYKTIKFVHFLA